MSWAITAKKPRQNAGQRSSSPPLCHRLPRLTSALLPCPSFALGFLELCAPLSLVLMTLAVCWPGVTLVKRAFFGARGGIDSLEFSALIVGLRVLSGCSLSFWCVLVSGYRRIGNCNDKSKDRRTRERSPHEAGTCLCLLSLSSRITQAWPLETSTLVEDVVLIVRNSTTQDLC
jgi:hypothetical protein